MASHGPSLKNKISPRGQQHNRQKHILPQLPKFKCKCGKRIDHVYCSTALAPDKLSSLSRQQLRWQCTLRKRLGEQTGSGKFGISMIDEPVILKASPCCSNTRHAHAASDQASALEQLAGATHSASSAEAVRLFAQ